VLNKSRLLTIEVSQANFSDMRKQMSADNKGMPRTPNANQSEADEEIAAVNFFLLSH
jgi:hypothetical protein